MRRQILLTCLLLTCLPALAQSTQDDNEVAEPENPLQQVRMMLPPPVSGAAYATMVGAEERSNFLKTGVTLSGGYVRNLMPGTAGLNVNEGTYLIQPTLALDRTSSRLHSMVTYDPAFAWYQAASKTVNTTDHSATADLQWRLAKYASLRVTENVRKLSTAFGQTTASFAPAVGGSTQFASDIFALYEPQVSNQTMAGVTWQYGRNDMVSGSGSFNMLHFTNAAQTGGFYNTNTEGGSGSWAHRFGMQQYGGGVYQYAMTRARPATATQAEKSYTQTHNLLAFYTVYLTPRLSLSLQGGEQYYILSEPGLADHRAWSPAANTSLGWQGDHTSFSVSYSRLISAGQGLVGAYLTNTASAAGRWQMSRTWTAAVGGSYGAMKESGSRGFASTIGSGHSLSGDATLLHNISSNLQLSCNYARIHQTYSGISSVASNPDSDRVLVSLSYLISRPMGR